MKILVCVKVSGGEINPFDEAALEWALRLSSDVTVVSMGPESTKSALTPLTRLGAGVVLISDPLYAGSDTLATSYILSTALRKKEYDLIFCGKQTTDGDTAQVGPMVSSMLGISLITNAMEVSAEETCVTAKTREGEISEDFPALITFERSCTLRFPSIFSKVSEVTVIDNSFLQCDPTRCGLQGSPTRVLETFENQSGRRKCKFISYDELIPLVKELSQKRKETFEIKNSGEKLGTVWAVGKEVQKNAEALGEKAVLIEESSAELIAAGILKEKPDAVLWNADYRGRKTAPVVAAMVNTGLCADCVKLEVSEGRLIMYRPAHGNSLYAKIKCLTNPQMATVRTETTSSDIIIAGGKGVSGKLDKLKSLLEELGAELAGSRGLVDMGKIPYSLQVGLTGKSVAPAVYIAIGISGAVQHTCAIEGAGTVIAINPDKNARIFEYADYGVVTEF